MSLRLNCGSGQRPFPKPFINIDAQAKWKPDIVADCSDLSQEIEDGSCELVVLHHVLEHFGCGEGIGMQREAFRVLQPGGSLLVFVPDMRALAQAWLVGKLDTESYMISVYGAYMGDEHDRHKFGFTRETLERELHVCEWREVKMFDWRKIAGADLARDYWILAMECVR